MTPNFPETNEAIYYTSMYFKIGRVAEHLEKFAGGYNLDYLDSWYKITMRCHEDMEHEINQHIYGSKDDLKLHFFEYLKGWLDNWIFHPEQYGDHFETIIEKANIKRTNDYEDKIIKKEDEFKLTVDYTKPHLEELETPKIELVYSQAIFGHRRPRKNMWFFENTEKLVLIDVAYLPQYMIMLNEIIESFKNRSIKYVERFFNNQLSKSVTTIIIPSLSEATSPSQDEPKQLEAPPSPKLKVNITVAQLVVLFKLLYEHKPSFFDVKNKGELYKFIADNFITKSSSEKGLSLDNIANTFPKPDTDSAKTWLPVFRQFITDIGKL